MLPVMTLAQFGSMPHETTAAETTSSSSTPNRARTTPPSPPAKDTPPTITPVITCSSKPLPKVESGEP